MVESDEDVDEDEAEYRKQVYKENRKTASSATGTVARSDSTAKLNQKSNELDQLQ